MPFVDENLIKLLINNRYLDKIATTFRGENKKYPEPLITIWEPKSFPILKHALFIKEFSLIKILNENDVKIIEIEDRLTQNINTLDV